MRVAQDSWSVASWWRAVRAAYRRRWAGLPDGFGDALWLVLALRVAFSLFAYLAAGWLQLAGPCAGGFESTPDLHTFGRDFRLFGVWQRYDACWYEDIAAVGYQPGDQGVAFFPLFPLLVSATGPLVGGNLTLAGLVVSGAAAFAAFAGAYRLVRCDFDEGIARRAVLYLAIFPTAFFFFAPFTEALFLALAVWVLYAARRGAWGWAALLAILIGFTRTQGSLLALPLAWEVVRGWRAGSRRLAPTLVPALPLASLLVYVLYGKFVLGLTNFQAQGTWGRTFRPPWSVVATSWRHIHERNDPIEALNLALFLFCCGLLVVGLRHLPVLYILYAAPQLLVIGTSQARFSPLMSTSRYVLVIFPIFVLLALLGEGRRLHYSWLIGSVLLLALLLLRFLQGPFVA